MYVARGRAIGVLLLGAYTVNFDSTKLGEGQYELNLPHIRAALRGEKQVFERLIPLPGGGVRDRIATDTPDEADGVVRGFSVHVADVTALREREAALERTIRERDAALAEVRVLRGLLPVCAQCKSVRDAGGRWQAIEKYVSERAAVRFSHGICPACPEVHYPDYAPELDPGARS